MTILLRAATVRDTWAIARVINAAFFDLAANQYLVPRAHERTNIFVPYFGFLVEDAIRNHTVTIAVDGDQIVGAAVWTPGADAGPAAEDYDRKLTLILGTKEPAYGARFAVFDELLHADQPRHDAYLAFLAVDPDHQGAGIGGRLLTAQHAVLDAKHHVGYLVASGPRSAEFYRRHGWENTADDVLWLPNDQPMYRMTRSPQVPADLPAVTP